MYSNFIDEPNNTTAKPNHQTTLTCCNVHYQYHRTQTSTLLSGLLNAPPHPVPQIRRVSRWHCALYKFTYLLTKTKHTMPTNFSIGNNSALSGLEIKNTVTEDPVRAKLFHGERVEFVSVSCYVHVLTTQHSCNITWNHRHTYCWDQSD